MAVKLTIILLFVISRTVFGSVELELGPVIGNYEQNAKTQVLGFNLGVFFGLEYGDFQAGVGSRSNIYFIEVDRVTSPFVAFPFGIEMRWKIGQWRVAGKWCWDDALYKDLTGIQQYEVAYEGPGNWRLGIGKQVSEMGWISVYYNFETFRSFKRRQPVEFTGDVTPPIEIRTLALVYSYEIF